MSAGVSLFADPEREVPLDRVELAEFEIGSVAEGEPVKIYGVNSGNTVLREVSIHVEGEGAKYVQMAHDKEDEPGVWAAPGESIMGTEGKKSLWPKDTFEFWLRPLFDFEDKEGEYEFEFVIKGRSIG